MTQNEAIQKTYLYATGKATMPTEGSTKYTKILALLNGAKDMWANESGIDWFSLRSLENIGTVSATDTFEYDTTLKVSKQEGDYIKIVHTDGETESYYTIVPASHLYNDNHDMDGEVAGVCALQAGNVVFERAFVSTDPQYGGAIYLPVYTTPDDMSEADEDVPVDDPYYIVFLAAAEYVSNDVTKQYREPGLVSKANNVLAGMVERNMAQFEKVYADSWTVPGESW